MNLLPILIALAALMAPQDPALDKAMATAAKYANQNNFQAALAAMEGAGANTCDDPVARTQYLVYRMRWTEDRLQRNDPELAGFAAIDEWNEIADSFAAITRMPRAGAAPWEHGSECLLNAGDLVQALSVADDGVSEHREAVNLHLQRGRVLMSLARKAAQVGRSEEEASRYAEAEAAFRVAMEQGKKLAAPCLRLAELKITLWANAGASDAAMRQEAVQLWTDAVKREPAGVDLGTTYNWLGADAVAPLSAYLEAEPENVDAIWFRGLAYWQTNPIDWPGLRDDLLKVLDANPGFVDANFYLGDGAMRRGQELSAAGNTADADTAYRAAAKFWAAYLDGRATVYAGSLRQSADGGSGMAERLTWLAWKAGFGFGQNDHAAAIMRCVVQITPEDGFAWSNFGLYLRDHAERLARAGEAAEAWIEEARAAYARAYALLPEDPQVMNDYAVIHHYYLHDEDEMVKDLYRRAKERAQQMLDAGGLDQADQERIGIALRDATNNLRKIEAGNRRNG